MSTLQFFTHVIFTSTFMGQSAVMTIYREVSRIYHSALCCMKHGISSAVLAWQHSLREKCPHHAKDVRWPCAEHTGTCIYAGQSKFPHFCINISDIYHFMLQFDSIIAEFWFLFCFSLTKILSGRSVLKVSLHVTILILLTLSYLPEFCSIKMTGWYVIVSLSMNFEKS